MRDDELPFHIATVFRERHFITAALTDVPGISMNVGSIGRRVADRPRCSRGDLQLRTHERSDVRRSLRQRD